MMSCFQNYRANIEPAMIDDWFESKLFGFPFLIVKKAFSNYTDDYKNKFPPQRGQIIQVAYQLVSGERILSGEKNGCVNLIVGMRCGEEVLVHGHCESCYDAKRPKNHTDLVRETRLREWIGKAKSEGCVTDREIADWSKNKIGLLPLGQVFLKYCENSKTENKAREDTIYQK